MTFDRLRIVTPDPYFNKDFLWEEPKHPSGEDNLDWRKKLNSESKVSKEKPITDFAIEYLERYLVVLKEILHQYILFK